MTGATIDPERIAAAVTAERLALCDMLDTLDTDEWSRPSLCDGWTVHHVAAHLALATRDTVWDLTKGLLRARGNFDRMTADTARSHADRFTPRDIVEQIRTNAHSTRRFPFSSRLDPLTDVIVHAQDIARPLDRSHAVVIDHAVPALTHVVASKWYGGIKRFEGFTLVATDAAWSGGTGPADVHGSVATLLLLATGRPVTNTELTGPGAQSLVAQLGSKKTR